MDRLSDFDYDFPQELIAQYPSARRDSSRLLVLKRQDKTIQHGRFCDIINFFRKGDLLVVNDTKVMPARLIGQRRTGGKVEILILRAVDAERYEALIKPLGRLKEGEVLFFPHGYSVKLVDAKKKIVEFKDGQAQALMEEIGNVPLPPYIRRNPEKLDRRRYQTVFARNAGAVAAPTAGLHFTKRLLSALKKKGVQIATLTLHVNYATFSPVRSEDISQHEMHDEYFEISASSVRQIRRAKKEYRRIFAVGTTVCKALEDSRTFLLDKTQKSEGPISQWSKLFIYPPFPFKIIDALITNFHLPRTTLLMLVAAFAGRDFILKAYQEAIKAKYRFFSYGDAMLIL